jgi:hypothetical protein
MLRSISIAAASLSGNVKAIAAPLDALRLRWRARRDEFARFQATVDGAKLCDELLAELDGALQARADEAITLREAAALSGYTVDHLARMIRQGKVTNAGRKHVPRLRRADLPCRRENGNARRTSASYNAAADARSLAGRLRRGGDYGNK